MSQYANNYKPVACSFVDHIEDVATKRREGIIEFYNDEGNKSLITGSVKTWVNEKGTEYLLTDTNHRVRLDRIIRLFDIPGPAASE